MNILEKIKNLFEDRDLPKAKYQENKAEFDSIIPKKVEAKYDKLEVELISASDSSYLVSMAARICVGMDVVENYEDRISHLSRILGRGHESILEHTNIVMVLHIPAHYHNLEYNDFLQSLKYVDFKFSRTGNDLHMLVSGSIRGFKHILRNIKDVNHNIFAQKIIESLYYSTESVFFEDLIKDGIMNKESFTFVDNMKIVPITFKYSDEDNTEVGKVEHKTIDVEDIVSILATEHASFEAIYEKVKKYGFTQEDMLDVAKVSVVFKNISRTASMQMIRHRVGISQESQRYTNYTNKPFIEPLQFENKVSKNDENIIDTTKTYKITLFNTDIMITSQELGDELCKTYGQLFDQGMTKQNARAFLPSNVYTKLMMTFDYRHLMHFFNMRLDKAAQAEIRNVAICLDKAFREYDPKFDMLYEIADAPVYKLENENFDEMNKEIDEVIEEEIIEEEK